MIRKQLVLLTIMLITISLFAQNIGEVSLKTIGQIRSSVKHDAYYKAVSNAVSNGEIKKLALNRENMGKTDHYFKYEVKVNGITDQKQSGRCWMFTGLNVMRPKVMNAFNLGNYEFSTNYLYFWDQFEKANLFLQSVINTSDKPMDNRRVEWLFKYPIGDGGVWNSLTNLIDKYGAVPKDVMPETKHSESTAFIRRLIKRKLREDGLTLREMATKGAKAKELENKKIEMLTDIYKMLSISLGEPPTEFEWRYKDKDKNLSELKKYTPKSFYKEAIGINFSDYVLFMDDPTRPYYKLYEIDLDRNVMEGKNWIYINLPADKIKAFAVNSIKDNEAMYFSCDVGKQLNNDIGILSVDNYDFNDLFGVDFSMNKKQRIMTFESGSTHGMALIGVDLDKEGKPVKWKLENSWGSKSGHNGYLTMTDKWFDEYMFRVVVNKKFVDAEILKILDQKPTLLPPWDPMFKYDE
ncbi:MAG: C1 family peptidase [Chlorobi bacterium]|nr:C1 family peptidase [Chlorobiota bacterium]